METTRLRGDLKKKEKIGNCERFMPWRLKLNRVKIVKSTKNCWRFVTDGPANGDKGWRDEMQSLIVIAPMIATGLVCRRRCACAVWERKKELRTAAILLSHYIVTIIIVYCIMICVLGLRVCETSIVLMLNRNRWCACCTGIDSFAVRRTARKINFVRSTGHRIDYSVGR